MSAPRGHKGVPTLPGWIGGYSSQDDAAAVSVVFLDGNSNPLGNGGSTLGTVLAVDRGSKTGLLQRQASASVPGGARFARITLTFSQQ